MANEINIQATLTLQRYSPALQGVGDLTITQTGTKCVSNVINVATGANSTIHGDLSNVEQWLAALN